MQRRDFIQSACGLCGMAALGSLLSGCASLPTFAVTDKTQRQIDVPLSAFVDKKGQPVDRILVKHSGLDHPFLLMKDGQYASHAIYLQCTHQNNGLTVQQSGLNCSLHGSWFGLDGSVKNGPATKPLRTFPVQRTDTSLTFSISA